MGRGRGKGKTLTVTTGLDDPGSGFEEPLPPYRRRGRPQKPFKDDIDEEKAEKIEEEEEEEEGEGDMKFQTPTKETKGSAAVESGKRRRKLQAQVKESSLSISQENGSGISSNIEESTRTNGFRLNGSRRKSKPRRAAEAGVDFD